MNVMLLWSDTWKSQIELNELVVEAIKMLRVQMSVNYLLIIIIIVWLLILTYKLFKTKQKTI